MNLIEANRELLKTIGGKLLFAIIVALVGRIIIYISKRIIQRGAMGNYKFDDSLANFLHRLISCIIIIILVIIILDAFNVNTASLIAVLGTAGVAVGLALKDTLSNVASGILLLVQHIYRKGDLIEFGSYLGTVKEITLFTTILETPDGIYVSAPNSCLWNAPLKNYTSNQRRRMDLIARISYQDSLETAFSTLSEIAAAEKRFLSDPAPQVMVQSLGDSSLNIMLRAWTNPDNYWPIYWEQMKNIKEKLEEAGIIIPLPKQDIRIISQDAPAGSEETPNRLPV